MINTDNVNYRSHILVEILMKEIITCRGFIRLALALVVDVHGHLKDALELGRGRLV